MLRFKKLGRGILFDHGRKYYEIFKLTLHNFEKTMSEIQIFLLGTVFGAGVTTVHYALNQGGEALAKTSKYLKLFEK